MVFLLAGTVLVALLVGSRANAKIFIAASAATLFATVLLLYPFHDGLGLVFRVAVNVTVFEVTAICTMLFLASVRGRLAPRPQGADSPAGPATDA